MKRYIILVLALAVVLSVAGCNKKHGNADTTVETTDVTYETTVAVTEPKPIDISTLLEGMPVHEVAYDHNFNTTFNKICADELSKFTDGQEYSEFIAIRFAEYPEIAIIGQIYTDAADDRIYGTKGINSVIWKGERYYTPGCNDAPSFQPYITDDFVCIVMAASNIGRMCYVYDGGVEDHTPSNVVDQGALAYLYEKDGVMEYLCYSREYGGMLHSNGPIMSLSTEDNSDDHFYDKGTVQLVDGKIKYAADESYTVWEWFISDGGPSETTGCKTLEDYSRWIKKDSEKYELQSLKAVKSDNSLIYRLTTMTVEEIEAEFEMTFNYAIAGGASCYGIPDHGIELVYTLRTESFKDPLPKDQKPWHIQTCENGYKIFPGIYVGMTSSELIEEYGIEKLNFSMGEILGGFTSAYYFGGHYVVLNWELPDDVARDLECVALNGTQEEEDNAMRNAAEKMRNGEIVASVICITVFGESE